MAHGGFTEAFASSSGPTRPAPSLGVDGEMVRVSIASLLEGADLPGTAQPDHSVAEHVGVNQHGMIMELYPSGSLSSVTLDFGLATPAAGATIGDVGAGDMFDTVAAGTQPLAGLLHEMLEPVGATASLGFAGEPTDAHALFASQSALVGADMPFAPASFDSLAVTNRFELGHGVPAWCGDGLPTPITDQHFIA